MAKEYYCDGISKRHRFIPTTYETVYLRYADKVYDVCLRCGKPKKSLREPYKTILQKEGE